MSISIDPNTTIYLCNTMLENNYRNTLSFTSEEKQLEYFQSKITHTFTNYSYARKEQSIYVDVPVDKLIGSDYLFYKNNTFSNKWYFCFITSMDYVNENTTKINIETDVIQTWQLTWVNKYCFIERATVNDDTIGANTVPENIEYGSEYITNGSPADFDYGVGQESKQWICMAVSDYPSSINQTTAQTYFKDAKCYNSLYSGLWFLFFQEYEDENLQNVIRWFDKEGKGDAIVSLFYVPSKLVENQTSVDVILASNVTIDGQTITSIGCTILAGSQNETVCGTYTLNRPSTINGYTPRNNKLLTYPYCYFNVNNNTGIVQDFHYEDFNSSSPSFKAVSALSQNGSTKLYPTNYKNTTGDNGYQWGIMASKLPTCAWASDYYLNWTALNGNYNDYKMTSGAIQGVLNSASSILDGNGTGVFSGVVGTVDAIASGLQSRHVAETTPNQSKGDSTGGDINFATGKYCYTITPMSIKNEYARIIDDYFSMFGYKINRVMRIFYTGRKNWNYIKTNGCNITGGMPQEDLQVIRKAFDTGITFWHNPNTMLDYSQDNSII